MLPRPYGPLGLRGLTLALFGPTLANPSTTGPTWAIRNPSLFGPLGLRGLTLALLGSLELMWANPSPGPTWPSSNPSLLGSLGLRGLTLALFVSLGPGTKTIRDSCWSVNS